MVRRLLTEFTGRKAKSPRPNPPESGGTGELIRGSKLGLKFPSAGRGARLDSGFFGALRPNSRWRLMLLSMKENSGVMPYVVRRWSLMAFTHSTLRRPTSSARRGPSRRASLRRLRLRTSRDMRVKPNRYGEALAKSPTRSDVSVRTSWDLPAQYWKDSPGDGGEEMVDQSLIIVRILIVTSG